MSKKRGPWWRRCFLAALTGASANQHVSTEAWAIVEVAVGIANEAVDQVPPPKRVRARA